MKILVIGAGGREHALAWKLSESAGVEEVYVSPGSLAMIDVASVIPAQNDMDYVELAKELNIDSKFFDTNDIHIHVPEGAVPKDGPSAGVTLTTAIVSALTNTAVYRDIAMTGEVTLRGNVLPIGGLREKSLAAHRVGIKKVLIPKNNVRDLDDVPETVKKAITFIPVETVSQVLKEALVH